MPGSSHPRESRLRAVSAKHAHRARTSAPGRPGADVRARWACFALTALSLLSRGCDDPGMDVAAEGLGELLRAGASVKKSAGAAYGGRRPARPVAPARQ